MSYSREYKALPFVVECRWPHNAYWETIAAFDCYEAAHDYGKRCYDNNRAGKLAYRMRSRDGRGKWSERAAWTYAP